MNHFMNNGKEMLRKDYEKYKKRGVTPPFMYKSYEQVVDEANGIQRKPVLGCLVMLIGSILFWGLIIWGIHSLSPLW
tara:strand:+ start:684 stop:914 length:231 start_codon:yes stop_codon:yes gene_type:complete